MHIIHNYIDRLMVHVLCPLHVLIYLDHFTIPTDWQSQPTACLLILAAKGISESNIPVVILTHELIYQNPLYYKIILFV